jgi:hypothetical protein
MDQLSCTTKKTLPSVSAWYYGNPLDMTLYKESNLNGGETTFYASKDINGLPYFIYTMNTILSEDTTKPVTVENATNHLQSLIKTQFEPGKGSKSNPNDTYAYISRAIVDFVDFQFKYLPDFSAFEVQVHSDGGIFNFNTPKRFIDKSINFTTIGKLPNLPDDLYIYDYYKEINETINKDLNSIFKFQLLGNDGYPLQESITDFFITTKEGNSTVKTEVIPTIQLADGIFALSLPLFPAPLDEPKWVEQFQNFTDKYVESYCGVVNAMMIAAGCLCDDVENQILRLIKSKTFLKALSMNISSAYDEGNRTVKACRTLIKTAWPQSCPSNFTTLKRQNGFQKIASIVDSYSKSTQILNPISSIIGIGPVVIEKALPYTIPAGATRRYGTSNPETIQNTYKSLSNIQPRCNSVSQAGADLPSSRVIDFGAMEGSFLFSYETYSVKDRVLVLQGGSQLHDSRCVGTNGYRNVQISLNPRESSNYVTVRVEPDCDGTTGTEWEWTAGCLNVVGGGIGGELDCSGWFSSLSCTCEDSSGYTYASTPIGNPEPNGCGPAGGGIFNSVLQWYIDDHWQKEFTDVCNNHDSCYSDCGVKRGTCDTNMCNGHQAACDSRKDQLDKIDVDCRVDFQTGLEICKDYYSNCRIQAYIICKAVRVGGSFPFKSAQGENCDCN